MLRLLARMGSHPLLLMLSGMDVGFSVLALRQHRLGLAGFDAACALVLLLLACRRD